MDHFSHLRCLVSNSIFILLILRTKKLKKIRTIRRTRLNKLVLNKPNSLPSAVIVMELAFHQSKIYWKTQTKKKIFSSTLNYDFESEKQLP